MTDNATSPFRLDLEQQRKRARELQRALRLGDAAARARFLRHHPRAEQLLPEALTRLSEAQLVIARELGLPSWPRLKAHTDALRHSRDAMAALSPAPDGGERTLHLRCGSDIVPALRQAGFNGDVLEYTDPLCLGPVTAGEDWLPRRAAFLATAFAQPLNRDPAAMADSLAAAEAALRDAPTRYARIVLWFEHDSYDQLILARCLARFAKAAPERLELISVGRYPGAARFIGLGQLPPEALRLLWSERQPVSPDALRVATEAWGALREPDPRGISGMVRSGTPALPTLAPALRRHLQELPWISDGLSLSQRLILRSLANGPRNFSAIFQSVTDHEQLPWLGDAMLLPILASLAPTALIGNEQEGSPHWAHMEFSMTALGHALLSGKTDWMAGHPAERWVGGVQVQGPGAGWRWDDDAGEVSPSP